MNSSSQKGTAEVTKKPVMKWQLTAWPNGPRSIRVNGENRTTRLWKRDYADEKTARRAAPHIHRRYPDAVIELMPFEFRGVFWHGDSKEMERFYWCPACDGRMRWVYDQWYCPRCGNEWADETIRPASA